jgi:hypothetical protein
MRHGIELAFWKIAVLATSVFTCGTTPGDEQAVRDARVRDARHVTVFSHRDVFAAWPANGGCWTWDGGREAAVAFVTGQFQPREGHNLVPPFTNRLARTTDGGDTWTLENPPGFFQTGKEIVPLPEAGIDFSHPDLALRIVSDGYHAGGPTDGGLCVSTDRGRSWSGPYPLPAETTSPFRDWRHDLTARTDYLVLSSSEILFLGAARSRDRTLWDLSFAAMVTDHGRSGRFLDWVPPAAEKNRVLMPSTVSLPGGRLITAVRVRGAGTDTNWVDAYGSENGGRQWTFLSKVGETGASNGNPPSLIRLAETRLCCTYGDRNRRNLYARFSDDAAATWGPELVIRADCPLDAGGDVDFGYSRSFARPDGRITTVYYWTESETAPCSIVATNWDPDSKPAEKPVEKPVE